MEHYKGLTRRNGTSLAWIGCVALVLVLPGCVDEPPPTAVLTADLPLHLEDHLDDAILQGSEVPLDIVAPVEWRFDRPQPDWKPVTPLLRSVEPVQMARTEDALRLTRTEAGAGPADGTHGGIYIDLPDWRLEEWASITVRARTADEVDHLEIEHNLRRELGPEGQTWPFLFDGEEVVVVNDGLEQEYQLRADWTWQDWEGPWQQLGVEVAFDTPGSSIDILSVSLVPKETRYAAAPAGVTLEAREQKHRPSIYMHAPGRLEYRVRIPESGHLDVSLGALRQDSPLTFTVTAEPDGEEARIVFQETHADRERWAQHSVDLSSMSGKTVALGLEVDAERAGTVALWGSPTLTGARISHKPNVILYIIDGGGADFMSVYGYNRRTTPNLERIAAEGALFDRAYSNSTWSKPSTTSFMTSLHHSVLGGFRSDGRPLPDQAVTMAQRLRGSGYQTAVIVSNPFAATLSGLQRGVDLLREAGVTPNSVSSTELHEDFWNWRQEFPGEPYWVHFQTTDVHAPYRPEPPFSGLFISPERRRKFLTWQSRLQEESGPFLDRFENLGIDRREYADAQRCLYDEVLAHQDHQLGQLVDRLKASGEWERTLLIVAADHGYVAAGWRVLDPLAPSWAPMFNSHMTRIPLIVVWPEHIPAGQRFRDPVSMIDLLPTVLELTDLPLPEIMQGQSLAPLLLGHEGWEPRPVIFDEFDVDRHTGELRGSLEMIEGRWGASLEINPSPEEESAGDGGGSQADRRPAPLLLYDLWRDPYCLRSLHEERPDLVAKYTGLLEARWAAHQALGREFSRFRNDTALSPEQLRTLRSLGYIQ